MAVDEEGVLGARLFDLDLGPVALAFAGASTPADQRAIDSIYMSIGPQPAAAPFAAAWLRHRGLAWAAAGDDTKSRFGSRTTIAGQLGRL